MRPLSSLRQMSIYSIFPRKHGPEGRLQEIMEDLPRIKALGTDILWLMPVQPVGLHARKGSHGSPYAILDYQAIDPALGTMKDFIQLSKATRQQGLRLMLDVVFHHSAPDAHFIQEHPEFLMRDASGQPFNKVADWSDVRDLNFASQALWDYLIETLLFWAPHVDGFRCDVANLVPCAFWEAAIQAVHRQWPHCIFLSETTESHFIKHLRDLGYEAASDAEILQHFDMSYDYDVHAAKQAWMQGKTSVAPYLQALEEQPSLLPDKAIKLHCLENHDQPRVASMITDEEKLRNAHAFNYFLDGPVLNYEGTEFAPSEQASLFDAKPMRHEKKVDLSDFFAKLSAIKHGFPERSQLHYQLLADEASCLITRKARGLGSAETLYGLFDLGRAPHSLTGLQWPGLPDGNYQELLEDRSLTVKEGQVVSTAEGCLKLPMILKKF